MIPPLMKLFYSPSPILISFDPFNVSMGWQRYRESVGGTTPFGFGWILINYGAMNWSLVILIKQLMIRTLRLLQDSSVRTRIKSFSLPLNTVVDLHPRKNLKILY